MGIPADYVAEVDRVRDELWRTVERVREAAGRRDREALRELAEAIRRTIDDGNQPTGGWLSSQVDDVRAELDGLYDGVFAPPAGAIPAGAPPAAGVGSPGGGDPGPRAAGPARPGRLPYVVELLDAPWPSARRRDLLARLVGPPSRARPLDALAEEVLAAPATPTRTRALRLLVLSPLGETSRHLTARLLAALHRKNALDSAVLDAAFAADPWLGRAIFDPEPATEPVGPECAAVVRDHADALTWRLTGTPDPADWKRAPATPVPRGLRFFLRGLDVWAGRSPYAVAADATGAARDATPDVAGATSPERIRLVDQLCAAELTPAELVELVELLRDRPAEERREALARRYATGDAEPLLALFGLTGAAPLLRVLLDLTAQGVGVAGGHAVACDLAGIRDAVAATGEDQARRLLELLHGRAAVEPVAAAMGWNRGAVVKRFGHHALQGIAAYGLLPLDAGETVLDRYLALRRSAKKGAALGPNRRHSHAAAIDVALGHLAQVAGYPDAALLEWDLEAEIASGSPGEWGAGDYTVAVRLEGADPGIVVTRAGRALRSVPAAVRREPVYAEARAYQERLRDQARRLRTGLLERLVATAGTLRPDEVTRLLALPAGAAMLPALIWRVDAAPERGDGLAVDGTLDPATVGLLEPDGAGGMALRRLDGTALPVDGPVSALHPTQLLGAGVLAAWQAEIVRRRLRQPVKQAFREFYTLSPAERDARTTSLRFAGHLLDGRVAGRLLSGRGWSTHGEYADGQATRRVGGCTAGVGAELWGGYFGGGPVLLDGVTFARDGVAIPLTEVPPVLFSEVMRDLDLAASVASLGRGRDWLAGDTSRVQLLSALVGELGLDRVSIDGHFAVVRGSRATYRVHLGSGSIHLEPGGHLCVVPASFGSRPHGRLFLPFADEETMTSVVLSKVLLLAEDEKITDRSILDQLR